MSAPAIPGVARVERPRFGHTAVRIFHVTSGEFLLRSATFGMAVVIARQYGAGVFGQYAAALATVTVISMLTDAGLPTAAVQRISTATIFEAGTEYSRLLFAKLFVSLFAAACMVVLAAVVHPTNAVGLLWTLVAVRIFLQSFAQLNFSTLKALQSTSTIGSIQALHCAALIGVTATAYAQRWSIAALLGGAALCQAGEYVGSGIAIWRHRVSVTPVRLAECIKVLRNTLPLGITATVAAFGLRFDVICLALLLPKTEVGEYAAAQWAMVACYVVASLFGSIVLSDMARIACHEDELSAYVARWSKVVLLALLPAAALSWFVAPVLIARFFGPQFHSASRLAAILLLAAPLVFLNSLQLNRAIARRDSRAYANTYATFMGLSAIVVVAVARWFGVTGVAVFATLREAALYLVLTASARRGVA